MEGPNEQGVTADTPEEKEREHLEVLSDWLDNPDKVFRFVIKNQNLFVTFNAVAIDYVDVFHQVSNVRMHMFLSADKEVANNVKLKRIEMWAKAIELYDQLMVDVDRPISREEELEALLKDNKLPRPEWVEFAGGAKGLRRLYKHLGFKTNREKGKEGGFIVSWKDLVELAKSGKWVKSWKEVKGMQ